MHFFCRNVLILHHLWNGGAKTIIEHFPSLLYRSTDILCCCRYAEATSDKLLQDFLVKEVLLKIVWCQYADLSCQIFAESSQDQDFASAVVKFPTSKSVLPRQICDEVAATIISILIPLSQEGVLHAFWSGFQSSCVGVLLDTSSGNESRLARLGTFFSVLDVKIPNKEESSNTWVLLDVVQPFVGKGFSAIKSSVSFCLFFIL